MADRLSQFCRDELGLPVVEKSNGIAPPSGLHHRKYPLRVAIHPTASTPDKCWLPSRFLRLALKLRDLGFSPQFDVAPHERDAWLHVEQLGIALPEFRTLTHVAAWLFESGWFIGNDSGIGHLASIPASPHAFAVMRRGIARTLAAGVGRGTRGGRQHLPADRAHARALLEIHAVRGARDACIRTTAGDAGLKRPAPASASAPHGGRMPCLPRMRSATRSCSMVIAHNLRKSGAEVAVFGTPAYALRRWFPALDIRPLPDDGVLAAALAPYDRVLQMHAHQPKPGLSAIHPHVGDSRADYAGAMRAVAWRTGSPSSVASRSVCRMWRATTASARRPGCSLVATGGAWRFILRRAPPTSVGRRDASSTSHGVCSSAATR
ncbi:MAG: glycosyltransferase family 9 protein [Pararobbsia sp.]